MRWDRPTSSHLLLQTPSFFWGGIVPPRPTCCQILNFFRVGPSHLVPPTSFYGVGPSRLVPHAASNHQFLWGGTGPPRPTCCFKPLVFMVWDHPTSPHLLPNPQFLWGGAVPPRPDSIDSVVLVFVLRNIVAVSATGDS